MHYNICVQFLKIIYRTLDFYTSSFWKIYIQDLTAGMHYIIYVQPLKIYMRDSEFIIYTSGIWNLYTRFWLWECIIIYTFRLLKKLYTGLWIYNLYIQILKFMYRTLTAGNALWYIHSAFKISIQDLKCWKIEGHYNIYIQLFKIYIQDHN